MSAKSEDVKDYFENPQLYFAGRYVVEARKKLVKELLGAPSEVRILDVGCGDGSISLQFLGDGNHITLVDFSQEMLELARRSIPRGQDENVCIHNINIEQFDGSPFDIVICLGVLAHVDSVDQTFRALVQHLKPGGRCLIQITDHDAPVSRLIRLFARVRQFYQSCGRYEVNKTTRLEIEGLAEKFGLSCLELRRYSIGVPGLGRILPQKLLQKFTESTLRREWLAPLCAEQVFLFQKE